MLHGLLYLVLRMTLRKGFTEKGNWGLEDLVSHIDSGKASWCTRSFQLHCLSAGCSILSLSPSEHTHSGPVTASLVPGLTPSENPVCRSNRHSLLICMPISCIHAQLLSQIPLFATPRAIAHQAPLSMGFPRQEYWSGLPFPTPGDLPEQSTTMGCRLTKTATCFLGPVSPALTLGTKFAASCSFSHSILKAILCSHYHFVYFTDKELQVQRGQ